MKRIAIVLFLTLFVILFFSPVKANNITFGNETTEIFNSTTLITNLRAFWDDGSERWALTYKVNNTYHIKTYNEEYEQIADFVVPALSGFPRFADIDKMYNARLFFAGVTNNIGGFYYGRTGYYDFSTLTWTTYNNEVSSSGTPPTSNIVSVNSLGHMVWNSDFRYAGLLDSKFYTNFAGEGTINVPTSYQPSQDHRLIQCGGRNHLVSMSGGVVRDHILDFTNMNYLKTYSVSYDLNPVIDQFEVYCDIDDSILYFTMTNSGYKIINVRAFNYIESGGDQFLIEMFTDTYNMTEYHPEPTAFFGNAYLTEGKGDYLFLYYTCFNVTYTINTLRESSYCSCEDWVDDECTSYLMRQKRVCVPYGCADPYRFVQSDWCELEYNRSLGLYEQKYKLVSDSQSCDTGFKSPHEYPEIRCDVSLDIPLNCSGVDTQTVMTLDIQKGYRTY